MFTDTAFLRRLFTLALPIALQNLVSASLSLASGLMVGQLGDTAVAAVGLANQVAFVLTLVLFGISSGCALFAAQFWGRGDVPNIRRVLGLCLLLSLGGAGLFVLAAELFPAAVLGFYSRDPAVIAAGSGYLRLAALGFLPMAVTFGLAATLRSTGDVRTPLAVSMGALTLNAALSYGLIFGLVGLPQMGIRGAALAAAVSRTLECIALVWLARRRRWPIITRPRALFDLDRAFAGRVLSRALPVIVGELLWSLGITTYNAVYAHIGTQAVAAVQIIGNIEMLAFVLFMGISDACAILVGNEIGAGRLPQAYQTAGRTLALAVAGALAMGLLLVGTAGHILDLYRVSPLVVEYARRLLWVVGGTLWVRVCNMILIVGVMRSGGDTRFALLLDAGTVWLAGVPLALLGGFVLRWPVYYVYLLIAAEEAIKWIVGLWRFFSKKWITNLAETFDMEPL